MTVTLTNAQGTFDITGIVSTAALSGEVRQCCRTLDLEVVSSPYDEHVPAVDCAVGSAVSLYEGGALPVANGGTGASDAAGAGMYRGAHGRRTGTPAQNECITKI